MDTTDRPWDMSFDRIQDIDPDNTEKIHIPLFPPYAGDYEVALRKEIAEIADHTTNCFDQLPYVRKLQHQHSRWFSWRKRAVWLELTREAGRKLGDIDRETWWIIHYDSRYHLGTGSGTHDLPVHIVPLFELHRIAKDFDILRREARPRDKLIHLMRTLRKELDNTSL